MSSSFMLDGGFYSVCVSSGMLSKENNLLISAFLQRALFIEVFFFLNQAFFTAVHVLS